MKCCCILHNLLLYCNLNGIELWEQNINWENFHPNLPTENEVDEIPICDPSVPDDETSNDMVTRRKVVQPLKVLDTTPRGWIFNSTNWPDYFSIKRR